MLINIFFISSLSLCFTTIFLLLILFKYGNKKIHKIWALFNLSVFIWGLGSSLVSLFPTNYIISEKLWRFACIGATFIPTFLLHMTYILEKRIRILLLFSYAQTIFFCTLLYQTSLVVTLPLNKYYYGFLSLTPGKLYFSWFFFWILIVSVSNIILIKFYNQKNKLEVDFKFLFLPIFIGFICGTINFLAPFKFYLFQFGNFGIALYCLMISYGIFKHQIMGIEVAYKKGLLYSILLGTLSGIYLLLILIIEHFFRGLAGYTSLPISMLLAFIIAIIFNPLRSKIQTLIDKFFLGKTSQELEEENEKLLQELERSEKLKAISTLALGLAHEVRNPLTTIKTFAEFLPHKYNEPEFVSKFSKIIPGEVERINNIVQKLLDFSKPSTLTFKKIDLNLLITDILDLFNSEFLKRGVKIEKKYASEQLTIEAEPSQIKQAILNIILNAIEANSKKIIINTDVYDNCFARIEVADDGCGISYEDSKNIFNPFFTTKDSGTGLGLSIAHQIIKNHTGQISVESQLSRGTTFRIKLPLIQTP